MRPQPRRTGTCLQIHCKKQEDQQVRLAGQSVPKAALPPYRVCSLCHGVFAACW